MLKLGLKIFLLFLISVEAFSEGTPFKISGKIKEAGEEETIAELKYMAIMEWLNKSSFKSYNEKLEPNVVDSFILDYKFERLKSENEIVLQGHIDTQGLIGWLRSKEMKKYAPSTLKPLLIISSEISGLILPGGKTTENIKTSAIATKIYEMIGGLMNKMDLKIELFNDNNFPFQRPPEKNKNIKRLKEYTKSNNCIIWAHLAPKNTKNIVRLYLYDLTHGEVVHIESAALNLPIGEYSNAALIKNELSQMVRSFEERFQKTINSEILISNLYIVTVENISLKTLSILKRELPKEPYINLLDLTLLQGAKATFKLYSMLDINDLIHKLQNISFGGLNLEMEKIGYNNIKAIIKNY